MPDKPVRAIDPLGIIALADVLVNHGPYTVHVKANRDLAAPVRTSLLAVPAKISRDLAVPVN